MLSPWKKSDDQPKQYVRKQRHHFTDKCPYSQSDGFLSSHLRVWETDHKEGWVPKNWCFQTVVLEKPLRSPLDSKDIKPVSPKGKQSWIFTGRTGVEAEAPILWPLAVKSRLIGKDPDAGKDWGQEDKWATQGQIIGWYHRLNGHEFEPTQGDSEGHGSLMCYSSWGCKESDTT